MSRFLRWVELMLFAGKLWSAGAQVHHKGWMNCGWVGVGRSKRGRVTSYEHCLVVCLFRVLLTTWHTFDLNAPFRAIVSQSLACLTNYFVSLMSFSMYRHLEHKECIFAVERERERAIYVYVTCFAFFMLCPYNCRHCMSLHLMFK